MFDPENFLMMLLMQSGVDAIKIKAARDLIEEFESPLIAIHSDVFVKRLRMIFPLDDGNSTQLQEQGVLIHKE